MFSKCSHIVPYLMYNKYEVNFICFEMPLNSAITFGLLTALTALLFDLDALVDFLSIGYFSLVVFASLRIQKL